LFISYILHPFGATDLHAIAPLGRFFSWDVCLGRAEHLARAFTRGDDDLHPITGTAHF